MAGLVDRVTYHVDYTTIKNGEATRVRRIFARFPAGGVDGGVDGTEYLKAAHPGCQIRINSVECVLTGAR